MLVGGGVGAFTVESHVLCFAQLTPRIVGVEHAIMRSFSVTQFLVFTPAAAGLGGRLEIAVPLSPPTPGNVAVGNIQFTNIREYHQDYGARIFKQRSPGAHGDHVEAAKIGSPILSFVADLIATDPSINISDVEDELRHANTLSIMDPDGLTHPVRIRTLQIARLGKLRYRFNVELAATPPVA